MPNLARDSLSLSEQFEAMNLDPGIVCYEHCSLGRLFAFALPPTCDMCGADLEKEPLAQPPFRLPYPFVRASQAPCCIVIKPTRGDFLHDYRSTLDLHIGVTDSEGQVHEYDIEGLHSDGTASWSQCLAVPILTSTTSEAPDPVWKEYWDFTLHSISTENWSEARYNEKTFNCYTFVLKFLTVLRPPSICTKTLTKTSFSHTYLLPVTTGAAKYISVYRSLLKKDVVPIPKRLKILKEPSKEALKSNAITTSAF